MTQKTAKTEREALEWIDTNPHHKAGWSDDGKFLTLANYHDSFRIPLAIHAIIKNDVTPGGMFDTRMFVLNARGRRRLNTLKKREASGIDPHKPRPYTRKPSHV